MALAVFCPPRIGFWIILSDRDNIRTSKRDLPKGYSRGLPRLRDGKSSGLPRVYDIALERISHGDGLEDPETLLGFLDAYQSTAVLTLGELWAIPIMLRLALIENLRRVSLGSPPKCVPKARPLPGRIV